jgi:UDP-N-acetylmuramoyl-L-alanyl-D-glutamate--2,6-diaminopimelate ligase
VGGGWAGRGSSNLCGVPSRPTLRPLRGTPRPLADIAALLGHPPVPDVAVSGVTHDSRQAGPGDLFAALPGAAVHGVEFAARAVAAGAAAVLTDREGAARLRVDVPVLAVADPRARLGEVAALVYGEPAKHLLMLGVTGTNGKTTTTYLIEAGLRAAGYRTGLIGTVETRFGDEHVASVRTTPEATDVHAMLALMREQGVTACVMEVSSHALVFGRVDGIVFDVAGFTNLSQDHLDFHTGMDDYFAAKASLFTPARARRAVVCVDDRYGRSLADTAGIPVVTVSVQEPKADWRVTGEKVAASGGSTGIDLAGPEGRRLVMSSPLPGDFNVPNAVLAVVMLLAAGVPAPEAIRGVAACPGVPGRMERVRSTGADEPLAVVDYAHTPDAIATVLQALRPSTRGRLIAVVGAGGDRDRRKRPLMGAAAARDADLVIVTDDNPRSEEPAAIRSAVLAGTVDVDPAERAEIRELGDRSAAIHAAVAAAAGGDADTVVVLGKGHEQGQEVAGVVHPFDDRVVLRQALEQWADRRRPEEERR